MRKQPEPNPATVQIVAIVVWLSTLVYAVIGVAIVQGGMMSAIVEPGSAPIMGLVFCAVGIPTALSSLLIRRVLLAKGVKTLAEKMRVTVIGLAVADTAGAIGLVYALLFGTLAVPFVLWGAALAVGILHFPSRAWLEEEGESR